MVTNSLQKSKSTAVAKPKFSAFVTTRRKSIEEVLGKDGATRFISAIVSAVATNPALAECEHDTLLSGALLGESLKLAHSPQLGQYYLVPFKDKKADKVLAQFILGVKGWKQLAIRSGQYRIINAVPVKEGEYLGIDCYTAEPKIRFISDADKREKLEVIGYYAYFELLNGYRRGLYWTKTHALEHADRYSQAFSLNAVNTEKMQKVSYADYLLGKYPKKDEWKYSSYWYKDFDGMACGKIVKALLNGGDAPLSVEMVQALSADENIIETDDDGFHYGNEDKFNAPTDDDIIDSIGFEEVVNDDELEAPRSSATRAKRTAKKTEEETGDDVESAFFDTKKK